MASAETHYSPPVPSFDAAPKVLIVVAPYYKDIADALVAGAKAMLEQSGATWELVEVPGALEIPPAIGIAMRQSDFDGYVALGCVIRGDTRHFEHVADGCAQGLMDVATRHGLPVVNGVLAVDRAEDAEARAGGSHGNKGEEAAMVAIEMADLLERCA